VLFFAPAVGAQGVPPPTVTVTLSAPSAGATYGGAPPTTGSVHATGFNGAIVQWVEAKLVWTRTGSPPPMPAPVAICGTPPDAAAPVPPNPCQGGGDVTFTNAPTPVPAYNGPYQLVVVAHAQDGLGQPNDGSKTVNYGVAIKPVQVANLKVSVKSRVATLSWNRNGEPDMQFYDIYRQAPGQKQGALIVRYLQPKPSDPGPKFVDDQAPAPGGEYTYTVFAVRNGPSGDPCSAAKAATTDCAVSAPAVAKATLPPGTPPASPPPPQSGPNGAPAGPPVIKSTTGSTPKLSSATSATTPTSELATPDPGFVRGLPYAGTNTTLASEGGGGDAVALTPGGGRPKSNQKGLLVPAATGAILFVGAFQLRWLKKRLDEPGTPII
jgi:hypothetical protein